MRNDSLVISTGQAHELALAFARNDWANAEIKALCAGDILAKVRQVILGYAEIKVVEHVIDCDVEPFIEPRWRVEEHKKGGQFKWDPQTIRLYLSKGQRGEASRMEGGKLRKELEGKPVVNANVLDYLFEHPHLIPEEWKGKAVYFWGTIYRDAVGNLDVRYLVFFENQWKWFYQRINQPAWHYHAFAALFESSN